MLYFTYTDKYIYILPKFLESAEAGTTWKDFRFREHSRHRYEPSGTILVYKTAFDII